MINGCEIHMHDGSGSGDNVERGGSSSPVTSHCNLSANPFWVPWTYFSRGLEPSHTSSLRIIDGYLSLPWSVRVY